MSRSKFAKGSPIKKTAFPLGEVFWLLRHGPVVLATTARAGRANIMTLSSDKPVAFESRVK